MIDLKKAWPDLEPVEKIGEGSYGTVYKCRKIENGKEVFSAVKVITVPKNESEYDVLKIDGFSKEATKQYFADIIDSFSSEIKLLEELKDQPNIVRIEDSKIVAHDEIKWDIYIKMELLTSFRDYSQSHTITREDVIRLGVDICSALEACERKKIIHRDIKPENIFVDKDGNFKLGDFGVARQLEKTNTTMSQKGTYNYMAPEVVFKKKYDKRADIYSLGMVMYKLLNNNREPFVDPDKQIIRYKDRSEAMDRRLKNERLPAPKNADANLAAIILNACEFEKEKRISSATEFKKLLLSVGGGKKVRVKKKLNKKALAVCACSALIIAGLLFGGFMLWRPDVKRANGNGILNNSKYGKVTDSGICGPDVEYAFYQKSGTLVLSGSGETYSYYALYDREALLLGEVPWFDYSKTIQNVVVEEGITKIGDGLFNNCMILSEVSLPETLTEIGGNAFYNCTAIVEVSIPDSVTKIGDGAFYKCVNLDDVKMSKNIRSVGASAFDEIGNAADYIEGERTCTYIDNVLVRYDYFDLGIETDTTYNILSGTRVIADGAFLDAADSGITRIILPDSVVSIGNFAFSSFKTLEQIIIPEGLEIIGKNAFWGCESLKEISIPESIEFIGEAAFINCNSLEKINLPDKGFELPSGLFNDTEYHNNQSNWTDNCLYIGNHLVDFKNSGSEEIKIKEGTKTVAIPESAEYSENLQIFIPASVERISHGSTYLKYIEVSENNPFFSSSDGVLFDKQKTKLIVYPSYKNSESYTVPESVKEIDDSAFAGCATVQKINLPEGLEKIGESAFANSGITSVVIPKSVESIPKDAFNCCEKLTSVKLPQGISKMEKGAFSGCASLESIVLPDSIEYIAQHAFRYCEALKSIKIPEKVFQISYCCFFGCNSLEKVELPASLISINADAFSHCSSLTEITFPESVKRINDRAFYCCESLKSFTVPESVDTIGSDAFGMTWSETDNEAVKIPDFTLNCYENSAAYDYAVENGINYKIIE